MLARYRIEHCTGVVTEIYADTRADDNAAIESQLLCNRPTLIDAINYAYEGYESRGAKFEQNTTRHALGLCSISGQWLAI